MSIKFFKESDFSNVPTHSNYSDPALNSYSAGWLGPILAHHCNRLLRERGKVVYAYDLSQDHLWFNEEDKNGTRNYQAILINIQPVEADSADKVLADILAFEEQFCKTQQTPKWGSLIDRAKKLLKQK